MLYTNSNITYEALRFIKNKGDFFMFITRYKNRNNICGFKMAEYRKNAKLSQIKMAKILADAGMDCDRHVVRRIEDGERFVTDIELKFISVVLGISIDALLED